MNTEIDADPPTPTGDTTASRLWRSVWRTHFYAGWIAAPVLVLLAVTGLVILYTEPINGRVHDEVVNVDPGDRAQSDRASFEDQRAAVTDAYPDLGLVAVIPSSGGGGHEGHGGGTSDGGADAEAADGPVAEPVSLDLVVDAAEDEGMSAGYTINLPVDTLDDPDNPVYGSYVITNPWPSRMHHQGAVYLDQFSGQTLAESTPSTWGKLQWATEWGIETHMGTQYGLVTRIVMTGACLLVLWNVATALVMWNKRRRKGTLGLPRRPVDVRIQRTLGITAVVLAAIYPIWGLSLVLVLLVDRFVVRRVPRLRVAFGMR